MFEEVKTIEVKLSKDDLHELFFALDLVDSTGTVGSARADKLAILASKINEAFHNFDDIVKMEK